MPTHACSDALEALESPLRLCPGSVHCVPLRAGAQLLCEEGWLQLHPADGLSATPTLLGAGQLIEVPRDGWQQLMAGARGCQLRVLAVPREALLRDALRAALARRLIQLAEWLRPLPDLDRQAGR